MNATTLSDNLTVRTDPFHRVSSSLSTFWHTYVAPLEPEPDFSRSFVTSANVIRSSAHASSFTLHKYALTRYAAAKADGDINPTPEAIRCLHGVLESYIVDNGPTPQFGSTPEGAMEVQWLAGGTLLSAVVENSGACNFYAVSPDRRVIFDEDLEAGEGPSLELRTEVQSVLAKMATRVKMRPRTFWD